MSDMELLQSQALADIASASSISQLEDIRLHWLGKKGLLTEKLKTLGQLSPEERKQFGQAANIFKQALENALQEKKEKVQKELLQKKLINECIDVSLPGVRQPIAGLHPITQTCLQLKDIFSSLGFSILQGPEIEDDEHNFSALNIPLHHPARAMQDTFYFPDNTLLRTQMSPVQIRALRELELPLRLVAMGRVYRRDFDITHTPMFHQMECLVVSEHVTLANLKGMLTSFLKEFFSQAVNLRFRPSYFPFTEPSYEVDVSCVRCGGEGCRICKQTGWLEILGCGMVHPNVLRNVNCDPERYRGFAFGLGIDRLVMLKYNIEDLRALFENDVRFLQQFV